MYTRPRSGGPHHLLRILLEPGGPILPLILCRFLVYLPLGKLGVHLALCHARPNFADQSLSHAAYRVILAVWLT